MTNYNFYQQPHHPLDDLKKFFRSGSALSLLIIMNVAVWLIIQFLKVIFFFLNDPDAGMLKSLILHAFGVPAAIPELIARPWTILTYNFLHLDLLHILFNMVWLYWFGKIFLEFLKPRQLVAVYLLGGISGGLVYILAFNIFPVFQNILPVSVALGASASVMAIVAAISFYVPDYMITLFLFGRIRIGYLALALFIFDFFMIPTGNSGGHIAHIGGAMFGVLYIFLMRNSLRTGQKFFRQSFTQNAGTWFRFKKKEQEPGTRTHSKPMTDDEYNLRKKENQKKIDEILEKISRGGYDSLTREEKEFLFRTSNKS